MRKLIITTGLLLLSLIGHTQELSGDWSGKLIVSDQRSIPFAFHLKFNSGSYQTIVDIPSKGISGMIAKNTELHNDSLKIDLTNVGMKYEGIINPNKTEINGKMKIGTSAFSLKLTKGLIEEVKRVRRFQEPVEPFPYKEEEVTFTNKKEHITLAGTLTLPKSIAQFPVAILISGSGPQDRDMTGAGHKPFLVLADHLTRKGIAVLRFDDRGFGKSTGDHSMATTEDFANDVLSAVEYLKSRPILISIKLD